ncbi:MAG: tRNA pseudouridine(55) synthase TruB [Gemmatimonadales bacterium]
MSSSTLTGVLLVDKPEGPTSHDVVARIRRLLGIRRIGHTGTLDPFASGLLVMLVGSATRLARFVTDQPKAYVGTIRLGQTTDTHDRTGSLTAEADASRVTPDQLTDAATRLTGTFDQIPPQHSAKKVNGVRSYRLARSGQRAELAPRTVTVTRFDLTDRVEDDVSFDVAVSSGTYVRALVRDLGEALGCGAHLSRLRRISVGAFDVSRATQPDSVTADHLLPARLAVRHLPSMSVSEAELERISHGGFVSAPSGASGVVAIVNEDQLIAVGSVADSVLRPKVVLTG